MPIRNESKVTPQLLPKLARWQSNNSPTDLGVVRFAFDIYPDIFLRKYGVAPWAAKSLFEYFKYDPSMTKEDRCHVIATFRDGSKTTWFNFLIQIYESTVGYYGIYYHNQILPPVDYQMMVSKTNKEAKKRLMSISSAMNRDSLTQYFGELKPTYRQVKKKDAQDTAELLILQNGIILNATGIESPIRGANVLNKRPDKITYDDPESSLNTKTSDTRDANARDVMQEAFAAITDDGAMIYIGNKIHMDDTIGKLLDKENPNWQKHFFVLSYKKTSDGQLIPGSGEPGEIAAWEKRFPMEKVIKRRRFYETQPKLGGLRGFLKEFYNRIVSDANFVVQKHYAKYERKYNINWLKFIEPGKKPNYINCKIIISCDPAISREKKSSDAVIGAVAYTSEEHRYVLDISSGKYDIEDRFIDDKRRPPLIAIEDKEIANIERRGCVQEIVRMFIKYNADGIVIENAGQQLAFYNQLDVLLTRLGIRTTVLPQVPPRSLNKEEKLRQVPLIYFESGKYWIRPGHDKLRFEIETFPDNKMDVLDMLFLNEQLAEFPQNVQHRDLGMVTEDSFNERGESYEEMDVDKGQLTNEYESWITS